MNTTFLLVVCLLVIAPTSGYEYIGDSYHQDVTKAYFTVKLSAGNYSLVFDNSGAIGTENTNTVTIMIHISFDQNRLTDTITLKG